MKILRVLFLLSYLSFSSEAIAKSQTVVAKGYGATQEKALDQAKRNAVEMVTGVWIASESTLKEDKLKTETTSFTTGVVESFTLLDSSDRIVTIEAVVVDRSREKLEVNNGELNASEQDQIKQLKQNKKDLQDSLEAIDNVTLATEFIITELQIDKTGSHLQIEGHLQFKPEWKEMYKGILKKTKDNVSLPNVAACDYEVNARVRVLGKKAKVLEIREIILTFNDKGLLKGDRPNLGLKEEYSIKQAIPSTMEKIEVEVYCSK